MAHVHWNDGRVITLARGDTATAAAALHAGQLYGLFFCGSPTNDADPVVEVVWSRTEPPAEVVVPRAAAGQGLASILFVSGSDTHTVSATLRAGSPGAQVQAMIGGVRMPANASAMNSQPLPANGKLHAFTTFSRFYTVVQDRWHAVMLQSERRQLICAQFTESTARVYVVHREPGTALHVQGVGQAIGRFQVQASDADEIQAYLQGNRTQLVWLTAGAAPSAGISLRALAPTCAQQASLR